MRSPDADRSSGPFHDEIMANHPPRCAHAADATGLLARGHHTRCDLLSAHASPLSHTNCVWSCPSCRPTQHACEYRADPSYVSACVRARTQTNMYHKHLIHPVGLRGRAERTDSDTNGGSSSTASARRCRAATMSHVMSPSNARIWLQ